MGEAKVAYEGTLAVADEGLVMSKGGAKDVIVDDDGMGGRLEGGAPAADADAPDAPAVC